MKKKLITIIFFLVCLNIVDAKFLNYRVHDYAEKIILNNDYKIITNLNALETNEYKQKNFSSYVSETNDFSPKSKQDLLNIYYTVLNNGWDNFSFYCDKSYSTCISDMEGLAKDKTKFSYINQLVHPFNTFETIETNYSTNGRIDIKINKKYSNEDIEKIKNKMNEITLKLNINSYNDVNDKIKVFHDYIAETNKYDKEDGGNSIYHSDTAIGTLFEGESICSGYTDTLAIFLNMLSLDNTRISTKDHIWNVVNINNKWYHIDLTWDDPIVSTGKDVIIYDYFLITTDELKNKNDGDHNFNEEIYNFLY